MSLLHCAMRLQQFVMLAVNHNFNNLTLAQMCYELKCNHSVQVCMEEQLQITVFVNSLHPPFLKSRNRLN